MNVYRNRDCRVKYMLHIGGNYLAGVVGPTPANDVRF